MKKATLATAVLLLLAGCGDSGNSGGQPNDPASFTGTTEDLKANDDTYPLDVSAPWPPPQSATDTKDMAQDVLATNYLVVLDNSGSMNEQECTANNETKLEAAKTALRAFVSSLPANDNTSLAVFYGTTGKTVVPFGSGEAHRRDFLAAIEPIGPDEGTPLYGALTFAYAYITEQAKRQFGYGVYRIVILTDGEYQDRDPGPLAKDIVRQTPIEVHAIGFCTAERHSLDLPGYTRFYTANDPASLARGFMSVQAETPVFDATSFR